MRVNRLALALLLVLACARQAEVSTPGRSYGAPATRLVVPVVGAAPPATPLHPELPIERERLREPAPPKLRDLPRVLPELGGSKPPSLCARLTAGPMRDARAVCGDSMALRLANALGLPAVEQRDRALAQLELCDELPLGLVRAVRADLARQCADVLIAPALRALKGPIDADLGETLLALALAARWGRAVEAPAPYSGNGREDSVAQYLTRTVRPWKQRQLAKIQALSSAASVLDRDGYGTTIVALARTRASHQLYSVARSSPIPTVVKRDYALRTRYFAVLDSELADLRTRMAEEDAQASELLFEQGIHRAPDADEWFELQRPDLANLRLEPPPAVLPISETERIIDRLPSPYAEALFGMTPLDDVRQLRLMVEHGLTPRQRLSLATRTLAPGSAEIVAYFHAALALRTRRLSHFDEVVALLQPVEPRTSAAELLLATARSGRTGASLRDSHTNEPTGWRFDVAALRALGDARGAGRAPAFALNNAAWLSLLANTPASLRVAEELANRARALAPNDPCLRPLYDDGFISEDRRPGCELPALP